MGKASECASFNIHLQNLAPPYSTVFTVAGSVAGYPQKYTGEFPKLSQH